LNFAAGVVTANYYTDDRINYGGDLTYFRNRLLI
jgi:hypothetical protein